MGEYIRGVVVKLHVTPKQEVLFKKNYGCTRKVHNEILNKYIAKYGDDFTIIPTRDELNQFLMESKKELPYLRETESTSLQQERMTYIKLLKIVLKARDIILQNFTQKRKYDLASDKPYDKKKDQ